MLYVVLMNTLAVPRVAFRLCGSLTLCDVTLTST